MTKPHILGVTRPAQTVVSLLFALSQYKIQLLKIGFYPSLPSALH